MSIINSVANQALTTTSNPTFNALNLNGTLTVFNGIAQIGVDGTQGQILLLAPTSTRGNLQLLAQNNAANYHTIIQNASMGQQTVASIPDPGATTANFLLSAGAGQTIPSITFSTTSGIIGTTTNNNAAAGSVGELVSSVIASGSPTSLTSTTNANVTSISLTAGDWDVWGNISYVPGAGTTAVSLIGWISATSATLPDASLYSAALIGGAALSIDVGFTVPMLRFSLATTTTIYMSTVAVFAVNTLGAAGGLYARRIR